jgi:hypothetical protein
MGFRTNPYPQSDKQKRWLAAKEEAAGLNMRDDHMRHLREMDEPEMRKYMAMLAGVIESLLPAADNARGRALFVALVFDDPGLAQYVSNCDRSTMVQALRECADRLEAREDIPR